MREIQTDPIKHQNVNKILKTNPSNILFSNHDTILHTIKNCNASKPNAM